MESVVTSSPPPSSSLSPLSPPPSTLSPLSPPPSLSPLSPPLQVQQEQGIVSQPCSDPIHDQVRVNTRTHTHTYKHVRPHTHMWTTPLPCSVCTSTWSCASVLKGSTGCADGVLHNALVMQSSYLQEHLTRWVGQGAGQRVLLAQVEWFVGQRVQVSLFAMCVHVYVRLSCVRLSVCV